MFIFRYRNAVFSRLLYCLVLIALCTVKASAQKDTLRVMAYNVLYYGNGCQGPDLKYHNYLRTIIAYCNPDILSLEKMASIPLSPEDKYGVAKLGFADSVLQYAVNAAFPGRYAYCPFTNNARANNTSVVFYDRHKLGYMSLVSSYVNGVDFNTYKLYYKDPGLLRTHDTTFLYITPNHDKSGDEFEEVRETQIAGTMISIKHHFLRLGNHINLGDFNSRSSDEGFYQVLTAPSDSGFRFFDPPFYPDQSFKYPANWDHEAKFAAYFTTSTRESASVPNSCGSGGGGKNWYDHIFLSSWIINNTNYVRYLPHSYRTVGNDGQRFKVSILNKNAHVNNSAPPDIIEALYQMSNKYPVMVDLEVTGNEKGISPADPEVPFARVVEKDTIIIKGFNDGYLNIEFPESLVGQEIKIECVDKIGEVRKTKRMKLKETAVRLKCYELIGDQYRVIISGKHNVIQEQEVTK